MMHLTFLYISNKYTGSAVSDYPFSAFTVLVGWQEGHLTCKKSHLKGSSWEIVQATRPNLEWYPEKIGLLNKRKTRSSRSDVNRKTDVLARNMV